MKSVCLALVSVAACAASSEPRLVKAEFPRLTAPPSMAADADLSSWRGAFQVTDFGMVMPDDRGENRWPTIVRAAWGPDALYVAVEAHDPEPRQVRAARHRRDTFPDLDLVGLDLDPSGQGQSCIRFIATPLGGQIDSLVTDANGEDSSYDCLWESVGVLTADGFVLKFRIPYSSLRRSPGDWGFRVLRVMPRERRYGIAWPPMKRDVSCDICQMAKVSGAPVEKASAPFLILPFATAKRDEAWDADLGRLGAPQTIRRMGLDVRYAGTSVTFDGTYRPDFSNVEADVDPLQINSRFKVLYPEKRPFFLEGMDLLGTQDSQHQFFSRALLDPQYGIKAAGRTDQTSWSLLHVRDQSGGGALASEGAEGTEGLASRDTAGAVRLRFDGRGSGLSLVGTDRALIGADGGGHSGGIYLNQFLGGNVQFKGSAVGAVARLPKADGTVTSLRGTTAAGQLDWSTRNWTASARHSITGRDLVLVSGFTDLQGYRYQNVNGGWRERWNSGSLSQASVRLRATRMVDWDGKPMERAIALLGSLETSGRVNVSGGWEPTGKAAAKGLTVDTWAAWINGGWNRHAEARPFVSFERRRTADLSTGLPARLRVVSTGAEGAVGAFSYDASLRESVLDRETDGARIVRGRKAQLGAAMSFPGSVYVQLQGFLVRYDKPAEVWTTDRYARVIVGWQPNAFTHAYLGWSGRSQRDPDQRLEPERLAARGLFAKFSYAVQF